MDNLTRAGYLAHGRGAAHQRRIAEALALIDRALDVCQSVYVACSFGKDSAVLLDLVMRRVPDIEARFIRWPETEYLGNYAEVIQQWEARGANIRILDLRRDTLDDTVADRWRWLRELAPTDGVFLGLRADESHARRMSLTVHGVFYRLKEGYWRISPLAWWTTADVAAYVMMHGLPTLDAYKARGFSERTASRIPRKGVRGKMLRQIKLEDPAAWEGLRRIYPDVEDWVDV